MKLKMCHSAIKRSAYRCSSLEAPQQDQSFRFVTLFQVDYRGQEHRNGKQGRIADYLVHRRRLRQFDYVAFPRSGGQFLFHFISLFYERTAIIVTTDLASTNDRVLCQRRKDDTALLDRLTHHWEIIEPERTLVAGRTAPDAPPPKQYARRAAQPDQLRPASAPRRAYASGGYKSTPTRVKVRRRLAGLCYGASQNSCPHPRRHRRTAVRALGLAMSCDGPAVARSPSQARIYFTLFTSLPRRPDPRCFRSTAWDALECLNPLSLGQAGKTHVTFVLRALAAYLLGVTSRDRRSTDWPTARPCRSWRSRSTPTAFAAPSLVAAPCLLN
ncbi:hypothetical protein CK214_27800 [Mesorhizobium sp. WSM3882]|nr:hypothetical protein CK214_27800 [Mesorhizobium sp. WSM3882]